MRLDFLGGRKRLADPPFRDILKSPPNRGSGFRADRLISINNSLGLDEYPFFNKPDLDVIARFDAHLGADILGNDNLVFASDYDKRHWILFR